MKSMDYGDISFEEFFTARLRDKGISLKRLSEATGIAPTHLENLLHGNFEHLPSSPYFRGYLIRVGKVLDFDGEEWWRKLKKEDFVKNSGPSDALPENRFVKKEIPKPAWIAGFVALIVIIYLATALPHILGKPTLVISYPAENPYVASSAIITLRGAVQNADALYLLCGNASSSEEIMVAPDGSWQKTVLLQDGPNTCEVTAKKFLGSETSITEQIVYYEMTASSSTTSSATLPTVHTAPEIPATGTYFN